MIIPPITHTAMGARVSPPSEKARAIGSMPNTVAAAVIRIGRSRTRPASTSASSSFEPAARSALAKSTSKIAALVTSPISMMMPMKLKMLRVMPETQMPPKAPITESGSETMMTKGWVRLSNCAARIM